MQKKHKIVRVPSNEELKFLIDEYKESRAVPADGLSKDELNLRLERLNEIEALLVSYRDFHYTVKH